MTYIDKDKAMNLDFRINVNLFEDCYKTAERAVQAYADAISKIPAAEVVERKHGKWKDDGDCLICSNCHKAFTFGGSNFCPNCGADMREEAKEND